MVNPEKYENTNIFVNLLEIKSYKKLMQKEADISAIRTIELYQRPDLVPDTFDLMHARAIHRHLFQDVYEWAGEIRSYEMQLNGDIFTPPDDIECYREYFCQCWQTNAVMFWIGPRCIHGKTCKQHKIFIAIMTIPACSP